MEAAGLTAEETARLQGRHGRSVAGFVALKHALAALFSEVCAGAAAAPAEFVLDHDAKGAPIVVSLPRRLRERVEGAADGRVLVSVSHTRGLACGLAVFEEERRGSARNLARD
jgi:phosphopantetheinyl transferase (holo-ACP synthase)